MIFTGLRLGLAIYIAGLYCGSLVQAQAIVEMRTRLESLWKVKDWPAAERVAISVTQQPDSTVSDWRNLVTLYRLQNKATEALQVAREIAKRPEASTADHNRLCWYLLETNEPTQARPACERAVALSRSSYAALVNLGHSYLLTGERTQAETWYREALENLATEEELIRGPLNDFDFFAKRGLVVEHAEASKKWFRNGWPILVEIRTGYSAALKLAEAEQNHSEALRNLNALRKRALHLLGDGPLAQRLQHNIRELATESDGGYPFSQKIEAAISSSRYARAVQLAIEAARLTPNDHASIAGGGRARYMLGQYGDAELQLTKAIKLSPDAAQYHLWRGQNRRKAGDYQKAIDDFTRLLQLDGPSDNALFNRGTTFLELGRVVDAVSDLTRLREPAYLVSAEVDLVKQGKAVTTQLEAANLILSAVELATRRGALKAAELHLIELFDLFRKRYTTKDGWETARGQSMSDHFISGGFRSRIRRAMPPESHESMHKYARFLIDQRVPEDEQEALQYINKAIALDSRSAKYYAFRAKLMSVRTSSDYYGEKIRDLTQAIELARGPDQKEYLNARGHAYSLSNPAAALADFRAAGNADDTVRTLVVLCRPQEALTEANKAIQDKSDSPFLYVMRAQIWEQLGNLERARQDKAKEQEIVAKLSPGNQELYKIASALSALTSRSASCK